jgi:hypothetical protein
MANLIISVKIETDIKISYEYTDGYKGKPSGYAIETIRTFIEEGYIEGQFISTYYGKRKATTHIGWWKIAEKGKENA